MVGLMEDKIYIYGKWQEKREKTDRATQVKLFDYQGSERVHRLGAIF
jgi:hypothetical protein